MKTSFSCQLRHDILSVSKSLDQTVCEFIIHLPLSVGPSILCPLVHVFTTEAACRIHRPIHRPSSVIRSNVHRPIYRPIHRPSSVDFVTEQGGLNFPC